MLLTIIGGVSAATREADAVHASKGQFSPCVVTGFALSRARPLLVCNSHLQTVFMGTDVVYTHKIRLEQVISVRPRPLPSALRAVAAALAPPTIQQRPARTHNQSIPKLRA